MHLIKYNLRNNPFAEVDRLLNNTLGNSRWAGLFDNQFNAARSFRVDVYDDDQEAYQVVAELPGIDKQDVSIQLENDVLTITAKRTVKQGEDEKTSQFSRTLTVSDDIDAEKITAKLEDGLLQVTLPKAAARKPKSITVN